MAKMKKAFNPKGVDTSSKGGDGDFELLPNGVYDVSIIETDYKQTNRGDGHYIALTFEVQGPTHEGRRVWANLNVDNPNPKAVEIAERDLAKILNATGFEGDMEDTNDILGAVLRVKLGKEEGKGEYKARNKVINYEAPSLEEVERNKSLFARRGAAAPTSDYDEIPF